jgi:hypothetical protein
MNENFASLTDEELENFRKAINGEISRRKEIERELAKEEFAKLINRINELQYKYDFVISCEEDDGSWISSASDFSFVG